MPYVVAGTLTLPESSKPATNVTITFRNLMTVSPLIVASESSVTTSAIGAYSISLQYSVYAVEVTYYNNRPISAGQIVLNSETQTGLDLPTLLNGGEYEPATPAWILQIEAWLVEAQNSANASANSAQTSQSHANASAASAAAASASAAQASQISGLSTVAEAIGMAALPLPDVWAPLTDDLRLITGHGREVKVGDVVVARLLEISRDSSATVPGTDGLPVSVAANVPRFVNGWLQLEGMSTNFIPNGSDNTAWSTFRCTTTKTTVTPTDDVSTIIVVLPWVKSGTMSAYFKRSETTGARAFFHGRTLCSFKIKADGTIDVINYGINASNAKAEVFGEYVRVSVSFSEYVEDGFTQVYIVGAAGVETFVSCVQLEPLPEATSYIHTSGASAIRAAESMAIKKENLSDGDITISVEVDTVKSLSGYSAHIYRENSSLFWLRREYDTNTVSTPNVDIPISARLGMCVHRVRRQGPEPKISLRVASSSSTLNRVLGPFHGDLIFGTQGGEPCFTKIRNIRIWKTFLTDEQEKAVK